MVRIFLLIVAVALSLGVSAAYADKPVDKPVARLDPALDELISLDAKLDEIRTGYGFTEGLVWVPQGRTGHLLLTNDLVVKKDGSIYFTDDTGGLRKRDDDPRRGVPFSGVFMWRNGKTSAVIRDIPHTNGLAFSPDEKILYANGSRERFVRAYDVEPDGTLTNSRLFINLNSDPRPGITDGMKVDIKGNLWESGPGGIWIISPQGKPLGHIQVPELVANLTFGDADYKTLYIAARTSVYKMRVNIRGIP
jgi:sugar lactone lactonase YvrE